MDAVMQTTIIRDIMPRSQFKVNRHRYLPRVVFFIILSSILNRVTTSSSWALVDFERTALGCIQECITLQNYCCSKTSTSINRILFRKFI
jgi:hypothetical protein